MSQISSDQNKDNLKSTDYFKSYLITPLFCTELAIGGRQKLQLTEGGQEHDDESCEHWNTVANPETQQSLN